MSLTWRGSLPTSKYSHTVHALRTVNEIGSRQLWRVVLMIDSDEDCRGLALAGA